MGSEESNQLAFAESGFAPAQISIGWVVLLTGFVGALFLVAFWVLVISSPLFLAAIVYFIIIDDHFLILISSIVLVTILFLCAFLGWTAGGILRGRMMPAVIACIGMLSFSGLVTVFMAELVRVLGRWEETFVFIVPAMIIPILVALLFGSFCTRGYWRKNR